MKIKTLLILAFLSIKMIASEPSLILGYGASQFKSPGQEQTTVATSYSLGFVQDFSSDESEKVRLAGLFNTNRSDDSTSVLSEIELQLSLKKIFLPRQSVAVGFQVAYPLSNTFNDYEIQGTGFGVNISYAYQILDAVTWNVTGKSTSYSLGVNDSEAFDKLTNQSFSTYISIGVN